MTTQPVLEKAAIPDAFRPRATYPFAQMEVGDCLLIQDFRQSESARVAAIQYARRNSPDMKFAVRKSRDGWRLIRVR